MESKFNVLAHKSLGVFINSSLFVVSNISYAALMTGALLLDASDRVEKKIKSLE